MSSGHAGGGCRKESGAPGRGDAEHPEEKGVNLSRDRRLPGMRKPGFDFAFDDLSESNVGIPHARAAIDERWDGRRRVA
jgi:hypothetical protein